MTAQAAGRHPENVPGTYYVDENCVGCGVCIELAPDHFTLHANGWYAHVKRQPETAAERAACESARSECPIEAIGGDGARQ